MGLIGKLKSLSVSGNHLSAQEEVAKYYQTAELPEEEDCHGCPHYPSSIKIDTTAELFDSAPKNAAQIIVASGQHDWQHDINDEPASWGKACKKLSEASDDLKAIAGGPVRINAGDLSTDGLVGDQVLVIVLPQFLQVVTTVATVVEDTIRIMKVASTKADPESYAPARPVLDRGFILLCSHSRRDKRCGVTAPILRKQLEVELRYANLYRDFDDDTRGGVRVVYVNHVGGHKFAANCFVYQNDGESVLMARVGPQHAKSIVEETIENGVVFPELVRNCSKWQSFQW